jgi:uncharacterized protein YciI
MRLVAIFDDTPRMPAVRERFEPAHLAYLREHVAEIPCAGGLRDSPGGPYCGGLWVMEVASKDRAVQLIEADPFFQAERRPYRLLVWGKALPDLQAVL